MSQQLPKKCPRCKTINNPEARKCSKCGQDLFGLHIERVPPDKGNTTMLLPENEPTALLSQSSSSKTKATSPSPAPDNSQAPSSERPATNSETTISPSLERNRPLIQRMMRRTIDSIVHHKLLSGTISLLLIAVIVIPFLLPAAQPKQPQPTPTHTNLPSLSRIETKLFPNGEYVGVNDGRSYPFDVDQPGQPHQRVDSDLKLQAAKALQDGNKEEAMTLWNQCLKVDTNDAEAMIYRANQNALGFPHLTLIVGLDFPTSSQISSDPDAIMATRSALQGASIAQQEFNDQHNDIKLRLLLANTGDDQYYIPYVAQQIANIVTRSDQTVVGILGWQVSAITMNMTSDLQSDGVNIPIVSQSASYDGLSQTSPDIFQIAPLNQEQAEAALTLTKMLSKTQAIVFLDKNDDLASQNFGQDFEQDFKTTFRSTPIEEGFTVNYTKAAEFSRELTDALKQVQHPDQLVVFFAGTTNYDAAQFQDALATLGNYPVFPVITGNAGYIAHPHSASYNRWYVLAYAFHDEYSKLIGNNHPFFQGYSDTFDLGQQHQKDDPYGYDLPDSTAIITYDAASILAHSIDQAQAGSNSPITPQEVEHQLGQTTWPGVSGQITLSPNTTPNDRALIVLKVKQTGFQMYCLHGTFSKSANNSIPAC